MSWCAGPGPPRRAPAPTPEPGRGRRHGRREDPPACERIISVDDEVLWKIKIARWRCAVWCAVPHRWLVTSGKREAGAPDDFYANLADRGRRWRAEYNGSHSPAVHTDTLVTPLLPTGSDMQRLELERQTRVVDELLDVVPELVLAAARSGVELMDEAGGCRLGILARRTELDEVYVGVRVVGPVQENVIAVILSAVPAVADPDRHARASPGLQPWGRANSERNPEGFVRVTPPRRVTAMSNPAYRSSSNVVFSATYHLVWCPKYRRRELAIGVVRHYVENQKLAA